MRHLILVVTTSPQQMDHLMTERPATYSKILSLTLIQIEIILYDPYIMLHTVLVWSIPIVYWVCCILSFLHKKLLEGINWFQIEWFSLGWFPFQNFWSKIDQVWFFDTVHFCTVLYSHFSGHPKLYNPLQSVPVFIQQITSLPRRKEYCKVLGLST